MASSLDAELTVAQAAFERGYLTVRDLRLALILHEELERVGTPRSLLALLPALPGHQESDLQAVYTSAQDSQLEETRGIPSPLRDVDVPDVIRSAALERALKPVTQDTERVRRSLAAIGIGDLPSGELGRIDAIPEAEPPRLPETIGPYAVLGEVLREPRRVRLRVEDEQGETLFLDWLQGSLSADEREQTARDAQAATRLRHRNLVAVVRSGKADDQPWWATEHCVGTTLAGELAQGPIGSSQAAWIVERLAHGLGAAHAQDLGRGGKLAAGEVWISPEGEPLVAGIAAAPARDSGGRPDAGEDVRGLGRLLYEVLTGHRPADPAGLPSQAQPEVPLDLDAICLRAMSPDAADRYPSALHLAEDLDLFLSGAEVEATAPALARAHRLALERPGLVVGLVVGVLVAFAVVAGLAWHAAGEADRRWRAAETATAAAEAEVARATERVNLLVQAAEDRRRAAQAPAATAPADAARAVWGTIDAVRAERGLAPPVRRRVLARAYDEVVRLRKNATLEDRDWDRVGWLALEADRAEDALAAFDRALTQLERGAEFLARADEGRARALLALGQMSKAEDALGKVLPHRRSRGEREPVALLSILELEMQLARRRGRDSAVEALQTEILALAAKLPDQGFDQATEARVVTVIEDLAAAEQARGALAFAREAWGWVYGRLAVQRPDGAASPARQRRAATIRLRLVQLDVALGRPPDPSGLGELARALRVLRADDPIAAGLSSASLWLQSVGHAEKGEVPKARQAAVDAVAEAQTARAADVPGSRLLLASARLQVGRTAKPEVALPELETTLLLLRALVAERSSDAGPKRVLAEALETLGAVRLERGEVQLAAPLARDALTLRRAVGPQAGLGEALLLVGLTQRKAGEAATAQRTFDEAVTLWEALHVAPSPRTTTGLRRALTYAAQEALKEDPKRALQLADRALKLQTGVHPVPELETLHNVARLLARERKPETPRDHLELAYALQAVKNPTVALGHFVTALADPKIRADLKRNNLYNGACAACLAAAIDPATAGARRKQALLWLAEDLGRRHRFLTRLAAEAARRDDPKLKARLTGLRERWREHLRWASADDPDLAALRDWPEFKRLIARYRGQGKPPRKR